MRTRQTPEYLAARIAERSQCVENANLAGGFATMATGARKRQLEKARADWIRAAHALADEIDGAPSATERALSDDQLLAALSG
jgi:hypothetical protein